MDLDALRAIANAVLYEGSMLYPYRTSALKNQRPGWSFGSLLPPQYVATHPGESDAMSADVLALAGTDAALTVQARFLQLPPEPQHACMEREVLAQAALAALLRQPAVIAFQFGPVQGCVEMTAEALSPGVIRISVTVRNTSVSANLPANRDQALQQALISAHAVVLLGHGELVSLLDPPEELRSAAESCRRQGVFPVLAGDPEKRNAMLLSPIILYDFPAIAPESRGDFFDSSEIDEMLTLRVLTLSEQEKQEISQGQSGSRSLLERVEQSSAHDLLRLHGVIRSGRPAELKPGDRVRLRPQRQADIFDIALAGKLATIASVETTLENETYFAVTVDDDPGADLGEARQIGHRFFFRADEIEPVR